MPHGAVNAHTQGEGCNKSVSKYRHLNDGGDLSALSALSDLSDMSDLSDLSDLKDQGGPRDYHRYG